MRRKDLNKNAAAFIGLFTILINVRIFQEEE